MGLRRKYLAALGVALLAAGGVQAETAPDSPIFARWMTDDGSAVIRIYACGQNLCGVIDRVLDPKAPANDVRNPDPAARARPLAGRTVLSGFTGSGTKWMGGSAYDPKSGRSYNSRLELQGNGKLKVTGCVLFICQSRYWTRAPAKS